MLDIILYCTRLGGAAGEGAAEAGGEYTQMNNE